MVGRVNKLFESYLVNRFQRVRIDDYVSDLKYIKCGVSQGSSLGSLLFIIYVNDLVKNVDSELFVDDTGLFAFGD